MSMRVFRALKSDHSLVTDGQSCPLCRKSFRQGERIVLTPVREPLKGIEDVPAICVHATCALAGMQTAHGEIARIKDGDGSPFAVVTTDGKQWKLEEVGLTD